MMFGAWGNPDHDDSISIIHAALDAGINFIDTADVYSAGESEVIVGKAIKGRRENVVLATKFHGPMGEDPNRAGNSRRWILQACEDSLRRLDTDYPRSLSGAPARAGYRYRRDVGRPQRSRPSGQGPLSAAVPPSRRPGSSKPNGLPTAVNGERFVCEQPPYSLWSAASRPRSCRPASVTAWV